MAVTGRWVAYGRPAAEALRAEISAAKGAEPLNPVTVIVPSNHVGVSARRLLGSGALGPVCGTGPGMVAVNFLTAYRLAELLGAARLAGSTRRPVSTPVIAAALRTVLQADPGVFGPVAQHPATEAALVAAYRELRDVSAETRSALAATGARARDVVRLCTQAHDHLKPKWYDEEDLTVAAAEAGGPLHELGPLVLYLPQRLSLHVAALLRSLAERTELLVLAGTTGDVRADGEVATSLDRLGLTIEAGPPPTSTLPSVAADRTRIVTTCDADDEVRVAVRAIVDAARAGTRLDRIAVLHASPEPYARLVHEHLEAAGIPANGSAVLPLAARAAGRTLLDLLALPSTGFRREAVFAWLGGAPILDQGRWAPIAAWERLSREAAVVAGRDNWDERLAALAHELDHEADQADNDADAPDWKAERLRAEAERARALRAFVLRLTDDLAAAAARPKKWGEHASWARRHLKSLLGGEDRRARDEWPVVEAKAAERVERALDRLGALDDVEPATTLDVFTRTLRLELDNDLGRVGRLGEGVLVGSIGMGVGLDLDLVIVLGLAEGTFPTPVRDDSLLPDHDREAARGELALRRGRIDRQHRELLATLAAARSQLLTIPRGDLRRSSERVPSRWALDVASALGDATDSRMWTADLLAAAAPWKEDVASFDHGLRTLDFPATEQEHRLRGLLSAYPTGRNAEALTKDTDAVLAAGAATVAARRSPAFTRFDGNLAAVAAAVPSPATRITSPTRLEAWASCPYGYLLQHVLNVERVENPEDELTITALDRGSLVHDALDRFLSEVLTSEAGPPAPSQPWTAAQRDRLAAIAAELFASYRHTGKTGRDIFWKREQRRILSELDRFLIDDSKHRAAHGLTPLATELPFGFSWSDLDAVSLALPDGRAVSFRGKADRVDVRADGAIHIVDYKTGKADKYKDLCAEEPDGRGTLLQLPVYGTAARMHRQHPDAPVQAEYWFTSHKGRWQRIGYAVDDALLARVGQTLGEIVAGIEAGVFPARPKEQTTAIWVDCWYCNPDALGIGELRRQWDTKRSDAGLMAYAALAEPEET